MAHLTAYRAARRLAGAAATLPLILVSAATAAPIRVGTGQAAAVAVDVGGTAHIAWNGSEMQFPSLHVCALPRGARTCTSSVTLPSFGGTVTRPYVFVDGGTVRVVSSRYGFAAGDFDRVFLFTSTNRGRTFGAPVDVGNLALGPGGGEAVAGPGAGVSIVSNNGARYQRVPVDGSARASASVPLNPDYPYNASVGLLGPATPVVTSETGGGTLAYSYYRTGDPLDPHSWKGPVAVGRGSYGRLAQVANGLYLAMSVPNGASADTHLEVRRFGPSFGAPTRIPGSVGGPEVAFARDGASRLQAAWPRNFAPPSPALYSSTSATGTRWSAPARILSRQPFYGVRMATAPDHRGVAVWTAGQGASARIEATPLPILGPRLTALSLTRTRFASSGRRGGTAVRYRLSEGARVLIVVRLRLPGGRYVRVGALTQRGRAGANALRFAGRLRGRALPPGSYRATVVAIDPDGNRSAAKSVIFRVLHPPSPCRSAGACRRG